MRILSFTLMALFSLFPFTGRADTLDPVPPSPFVENLGQVIDTDDELHEEIEFYSDVRGYRTYFSSDAVYYAWHRGDTSHAVDTIYRMDMNFVNCNTNVGITAGDTMVGQLNFLLGYLPDFVTDVHQYDGITYTNLYRSINLSVTNNSWSLVYNYDIATDGNPADIIMNFEGATSIEINENGELELTSEFGEILYEVPTAYYMAGETQVPLDVEYVLSETSLSFAVDEAASGRHVYISMGRVAYPPSSAFAVTGQQQLYWSTYFGTDGGSEMHESHIDADGDLYIAGGTAAGIFPASNSLMLTFAGGWDAIIAKFNTGRQLLYVTWIGGNGHDEAWSITSQSHHPCFNGPTTSSNFPTTTNAVQGYPGLQSSFYVKLDDDNFGGNLLISTYLGYNTFGNGGFAITSDASGNVYIGTNTFQDNSVPIVNLSGAYNQSSSGGSFEGYIAKFNSSDVQVWGTYFGGSSWDIVTGINVGTNGKLYMMGWSMSPTATQNCSSGCTSNANPGSFPIADPQNSVSYQQQLAGSGQRDAFIVVFNSNLTLAWSTMFGGTGDEGYCEGHDGAIVVDNESGAFYVTTSSRSTNFPIQPTTQPSNTDVYWQNSLAGGQNDAVFAKFNPSYHLVYCTYYGGDGDDVGSDLTVAHAFSRTLVYLSGGIFMSLGYTTFPVLTQTNYLNIGPDGTAQGYIVMFDDDPDDFDALPERDWASCISNGLGYTWFVSANDDRLVAGGWTGINLNPAPVSDPDPPSFVQETPLASVNGYILEFVFCNTCRFAQPDNFVQAQPEVYPNPSRDGMFTINVPAEMKESVISVTVYDVMGRIVFTEYTSGVYPVTIDLSSQPAGVYTVQMGNGERSNTLRIVNGKQE